MDSYLLIITPVRADPQFEAKMQVVRSVCSSEGLECLLPERNPGGFDLKVAIETILGASVIVADLSYARPSCYYELGLVEAIGRRPALIAAMGTEIFQHSERGAVAFYNDLKSYGDIVRGAIRMVGAEHVASG